MNDKPIRGSAKAVIAVTSYEQHVYEDVKDGPNLVELRITETFTGDIQGEGVVRFIQALRKDGGASFCGTERVKGSIGGRTGTFLLQDEGTLEGKDVKGKWFVVPGSGTGELVGLRGEGGFEAELGQHASVWLDWRID
jgi:hypothetical protein